MPEIIYSLKAQAFAWFKSTEKGMFIKAIRYAPAAEEHGTTEEIEKLVFNFPYSRIDVAEGIVRKWAIEYVEGRDES